MIAKIGRTLPWLAGVLGIAATSSEVLAQGNTFNPYGNSGYADYREFGSPMYSNNPALPGQALLNSEPSLTRPRANSYQQYTNDLDGADPAATNYGRIGSSNLPYFQAYQRLNSQNNRYRPGDFSEAERKYNDRLKKRDAAYSAALAETDPAKRAKLMRQVEQDSLLRPSTTSRLREATSPMTPKSATGRTGTAATTRTPAPPIAGISSPSRARRTQAPPPLTGSNTRRSSATGSTPPPPLIARPSTSRPAPDPSTIPVPPPR